MATSDDNFAEYFTLAQAEALTARESHIVDLRYGFASGEPHIEAESTILIPRILMVGIIVINYWIVTNRNRGDAT